MSGEYGATRRAAEMPNIDGETFQIATRAETTVSQLVEKLLPILSAAGIGHVNLHQDAPLLGNIRRKFHDTRKAADVLGWRAETKLTDGLRKTVLWFLDRPGTGAASVG